jgi:leucyl-tRNA synthetase
MPNWAGSSWYYLRYFDAHNDKAFADRGKLDYWGAVDLYLGGMEHTTLHLLYSRFWHQFLYDQGLAPTPEPYLARRGQGIILAADGTKMSKSKGNIVDPIDIIDSGYGADATRLAMAFIAPYDQATPWSPESVAGTYRFLNRVWILVQEFLESDQSGNETGSTSQAVQPIIHRLIKTISEDLTKLNFNTAVAAQMETVNELYKLKEQDHFIGRESWQFAIESLLQLLSPFAPHLSEELWQQLGHSGSIHTSQWPSYDEKYLIRDSATIVVQINGKLRARLTLPVDVTEEQAANAAKTEPKIIEHLAGREIKKTIYVPGRLVNLVV